MNKLTVLALQFAIILPLVGEEKVGVVRYRS